MTRFNVQNAAQEVALYCRVDGGGSPDDLKSAAHLQKTMLEQYVQKHGLRITACYEDLGFTGADLSRPGIQAMLTDCLNGLFETVLVVNRSRIFRGFPGDCPDWPFRILALDALSLQSEL